MPQAQYDGDRGQFVQPFPALIFGPAEKSEARGIEDHQCQERAPAEPGFPVSEVGEQNGHGRGQREATPHRGDPAMSGDAVEIALDSIDEHRDRELRLRRANRVGPHGRDDGGANVSHVTLHRMRTHPVSRRRPIPKPR